MAVLDPGDILTSTVFGLRLQIGNFFAGDVHPCTKTYFWDKEHGQEGDVLMSGAATFHSFVKNITWLEGATSSPFLRQLRKAVESSKTERLSLRFHLDQYQKCPFSDNFNWGRVVGAIGVSGTRAPLSTVHGRELEPKDKKRVQIANFALDHQNRRVHADFGNSFPTTLNGSHLLTSVGQLAVGYSRDMFPRHLSCLNDFQWLGLVNYRRQNWYQNTAGIETFPESYPMTKEQMNKLERTPLVVAEVEGVWPDISCKEIFLEEAAHGTLVRPHGEWIYRRDAEEPFSFDLFVTKFGKPLPGAPVQLRLEDETLKNPPLTVSPEPSVTNDKGIVSFTIPTSDPKTPRKVIDGQMYRILFRTGTQAFRNTFVIYVLIWDKYQIYSEPNWVDHVYPIFKQFANLSPAMTKNIIDLGNFDEVIKSRKIIQMSMLLPFEHPNYMPITRDLSKAKRKMILRWLSQPHLLHGPPEKTSRRQLQQKRGSFPSVIQSLTRTVNCQRNPVMSMKHSRESCQGQIENSTPKVLPWKEEWTSHSAAADVTSVNYRLSPKSTLKQRFDGSTKQVLNSVKERLHKTHLFPAMKRVPREQPGRVNGQNRGTILMSERKLKREQSRFSLEQLRQDLQTALELEHATIPPYLTALYSIKDGHNSKVRHSMKTIVVQEMLHMSLVANLINAVGGNPSLTHPTFVPSYPSRLPGNVHEGLIVPLQNLSRALIKDVFMKIEEPTLTIKALQDRRYVMKHTVDYWHQRGVDLYDKSATKTKEKTPNRGLSGLLENNELEDEERKGREEERVPKQEHTERDTQTTEYRRNDGKAGQLSCVTQDDSSASLKSQNIVETHKDGIGGFYQHIIKTLGHLTKCGQDNSIFTGDPSRQLTSEVWYARKAFGHGNIVKVSDYSSAVRAITEIIEQGEGSSPCEPIAADIDIHDLSHYFSFYSIYKGRTVQHKSWNGTELPAGISDELRKWFKICGSIYDFDGERIDFNPSGVWPIAHNPKISDHIPWSTSYLQAFAFNKAYTKLLGTLEKAFNGQPEGIIDAMGVMFSVSLNAKRLVRMPLKFGDNPDVGPNAAPIYAPIIR